MRVRLFGDFRAGVLIHFFAQCSYLVAAGQYFVQQRAPYVWPLVAFGVAALYGLFAFWRARQRETYVLFPTVGLAIGNSVLLNYEATYIGFYFLAALLGILSIAVFRRKGDPAWDHPFNPSIIGGFVLTMLLPSNFSVGNWAHDGNLLLLILVSGLACAIMNRKLAASLSYFGGFALASVVAYFCWFRFQEGRESLLNPFVLSGVLVSARGLIFAFHVITDPRTSPPSWRGQMAFGLSIGGVDLLCRCFNLLYSDQIAYLLIQGGYWWLFRTPALQVADSETAPMTIQAERV